MNNTSLKVNPIINAAKERSLRKDLLRADMYWALTSRDGDVAEISVRDAAGMPVAAISYNVVTHDMKTFNPPGGL